MNIKLVGIFWFIFGSLYTKYLIVFKGLVIDTDISNVCKWCGRTIGDVDYYEIYKDFRKLSAIKFIIGLDCSRCGHTTNIDILKEK